MDDRRKLGRKDLGSIIAELQPGALSVASSTTSAVTNCTG